MTPSGAAPVYYCPMHPTTVSDKPGECPICQMNLEPVPGSLSPAGRRRRARAAILYYRSPMDPTVRSDKPAKDSTGMDFVPVYADEVRQGGGMVPGRSVVTLSSERRALLGVRTEKSATRASIGPSAPSAGGRDERRLAHVHTKFEGTSSASTWISPASS